MFPEVIVGKGRGGRRGGQLAESVVVLVLRDGHIVGRLREC